MVATMNEASINTNTTNHVEKKKKKKGATEHSSEAIT